MRALEYLFTLYEIVLILRVLVSWIPFNPRSFLIKILYRLTEPILQPLRKLLPVDALGFDLSPFIVLFVIELIKSALFRLF